MTLYTHLLLLLKFYWQICALPPPTGMECGSEVTSHYIKTKKQTSILSIILITLRSVKTIRHLSLEVFLRILTNQSLFFHSEVLDKLPYVFLTLLTVYHQQSAHVYLF